MPANQVSKPSYIGIGAQKCASTWLHRILAEHPDVSVPEVKELDFFSYRYDHGYQWYERCFQNIKPARARRDLAFLFRRAHGTRARRALPARSQDSALLA